MILAGDVGGTSTRLAFFKGSQQVSQERIFASREFPNLETIIGAFLKENKRSVSKACLGIAGPVREGVCKATNLPWLIDAKDLSRKLKISSVTLLNDLEANAYGIALLKPEELHLVQAGLPAQTGNRALISAGTGLGQAGLYWNGKKHCPFACEGGHVDFAPRNEEEVALLLYLKKQFPHVSYERIISGPGMQALYAFLVETGRKPPAPTAPRDGAAISALGRENQDPTCSYVVDWFLSLYGAEAGNTALKFLAFGGCYLGGGIIPSLKDRIQSGAFLSSFCDKGRFRDLLASIPIWVILNPNTALLGAAAFGERQ